MRRKKTPWEALGISHEASPEEIRARYVALVKLHPPDRDPAQFERIREAYESVRDPRRVAAERLFGPAPLPSLDELAEVLRFAPRRPAGASAWLRALEELSR